VLSLTVPQLEYAINPEQETNQTGCTDQAEHYANIIDISDGSDIDDTPDLLEPTD
jgi:hypothetical protein